MIIYLKPGTEKTKQDLLLQTLNARGVDSYFAAPYNAIIAPRLTNTEILSGYDFISSCKPVETPFQLSSKAFKNQSSFDVKGVAVGGSYFNIIAGPCAVESEAQIFEIAAFISSLGIRFIRGGAYKPRTSPYTFRGLGKQGLQLIHEAAKKYDLRVVTEIMDLSLLDEVYEYADILQVGSRNMSNFYMLSELGKIDKPVLLKRGMDARVYEWLLAADYLLSGGNEQVILCERGIRGFDPISRNVMDVAAIPLVKSLSHLPVFADPSHGTGVAKLVTPMAMASAFAGADGLMLEIHPQPAKALSDAAQTLNFEEFSALIGKLRQHYTQVMQRDLDLGVTSTATL